jgi:hypothetical protein
VSDPNYTPGTGFAAIADEIMSLADAIRDLIRPVTDNLDVGELDEHGGGELDEHSARESRIAAAATMLVTALRFLAQAGQEGYREDLDAHLAATEGDIGSAVRYIREIRALHAAALAKRRPESPAYVTPIGPGPFALSSVTVRLPGTGDELLVELENDGQVRWSSPQHGQLPVSTLEQIDLVALLRGLDDVYLRSIYGRDGD